MLYHVQTEDRGASHAVIDTMVYHSGRVLHRRANSYADLLPLDAAREQALKDRVSTQHQSILDELRSGVLKLAQQAPPATAPASRGITNASCAFPSVPVAVEYSEGSEAPSMRAVTRAPETPAPSLFLKTSTCSVARFPANQLFAFSNSRARESITAGAVAGGACCANFNTPERNSSRIDWC